MEVTKLAKRRSKTKKILPKIGRKTAKNQFEFDCWKALSHELPKGSTIEYEPVKIDYYIQSTYCPDYVITRKDGSIIYVEAKGYFDYAAQRKMVAVKEQYPDYDIRMLFYRDSPIRKGSNFRYSDWCNKHGFLFAVKEVPKDWFENED